LGKADDAEEETGKCTLRDRRGKGPGIRGKIRRDNVGKIPWQQGLVATCKDFLHEAKAEGKKSQMGLANESVVAMNGE
jgi:hypothetical protein